MSRFDPAQYGPIFGPLQAAAPLNELGPGRPERGVEQRLAAISLAEAFKPAKIVNSEMAQGCLAGLWLMYDFLDRSHEISQSLDTPTGSYWHGILHRREPDYGNAKYWFRHVGQHPIYEPLAEAARKLAIEAAVDRAAAFLADQTEWDPCQFVDLCAAAASGQSASAQLCRLIQQRECRLLFDFCYRRAIEQ